MACPRCGASTNKTIAPGYVECTGRLTEMFPDPATGHMVGRSAACLHRYHEGGSQEQSKLCFCRTFAIGSCGACGVFVCGDHSVQGNPRICSRCIEAGKRAAAERQRRADAEVQARRDAEWAKVRQIDDPVVRLMFGARLHNPPGVTKVETNPWGRASLTDVMCEESRHRQQTDLVGLCPELWPGGAAGDPPWESLQFGRWFAARATDAGIVPTLGYCLPVRRSIFKPRDDLVRGAPRPAWHLPEGSTSLLTPLIDAETRKWDTRDFADAYVLPDGRIVVEPFMQQGTKPHPARLSPNGLAAMAEILWPQAQS